MAYEVHFRDRRTGERAVRTTNLDWDGDSSPFWWREHGMSDDGNRSAAMYDHDPRKTLAASRYRNVIVVEKIVNAGAVVFQDEGSDVPIPDSALDLLDAHMQSAAVQFQELWCCLMHVNRDIPLAIEKARMERDRLASHEAGQRWLPELDAALAAAERIDAQDKARDPLSEDDLATLERVADQVCEEMWANLPLS